MGLLGNIFLGVCIILAVGILVGQLTIPEAMTFLFNGILFWTFWGLIAIVVSILIFIIAVVIYAIMDSR